MENTTFRYARTEIKFSVTYAYYDYRVINNKEIFIATKIIILLRSEKEYL